MIKISSRKNFLLERVTNDVTRANAVIERKKSFRKFDFFQLCCVNEKERQTTKQKKT